MLRQKKKWIKPNQQQQPLSRSHASLSFVPLFQKCMASIFMVVKTICLENKDTKCFVPICPALSAAKFFKILLFRKNLVAPLTIARLEQYTGNSMHVCHEGSKSTSQV